MSRSILAVLAVLAFVVLAGCGSGPGVNEMSSGGEAAAPENDELVLGEEFVPADEPGDLALGLGEEPFSLEAASDLPPAEVAADASPLRLWLTGGAKLKKDPTTGRMYYPMKYGESRPIRCTWNGGAVSGAPVWSITPDYHWFVPECFFNAMRLPPTSLGRNFLYVKYMEGGIVNLDRVKVSYGGQTQSIWIKVSGTWPKPGFTAPLNPAGARLKVTGNASMWSTSTMHGARYFQTTQGGIVTLRARIVGDYPNPPAPQWTAQQTKDKFVGASTGWKIRFRIKGQRGYGWEYPLTVKIGEYAVTVFVGGV